MLSYRMPRALHTALVSAIAIGPACGGSSAVSITEQRAPGASGHGDVAARRATLRALLDAQWQYTLRTQPEFATVLGDDRYNDRWADLSQQAIAADLAETKRFLDRFLAIDTTGFTDQESLDHALMVRQLRETVDNARFENWLMPVNQFDGLHLAPPRLVSQIPVATVKNLEAYVVRLETLPTLLEQIAALLREGAHKHLVPPAILLTQAAKQARVLATGTPEQSPFAGPVMNFAAGIATDVRPRLRAAVIAAIRDRVQPAYRAFADYLANEYAPQGRADPGLWALPDGTARYAAKVQIATTTNLSPEEIHQIGLAEVKRIETEQEQLGKSLGFSTLSAFRAHIRGDKNLFARSRQDIVDLHQRYTDQMYRKLAELFGRLPKASMMILPVETFREKESAGAEYTQGTPDGSRPGIVRVNTYEATKRLVTEIEATAYHEGVPGHHMQIALQQELTDLPAFRKQLGFVAYQEGWALYAERLGKEVGFYRDPYSDYGRLQAEMLRAIRLVVDTGLHAKRWTRAQVVEFFHAHSTMEEVAIQSETDRYIAIPGQALGYKVGQLTISRLRDKARQALGSAFDIRAFHDEVLGAGALPLDILEHRVDDWIARSKR